MSRRLSAGNARVSQMEMGGIPFLIRFPDRKTGARLALPPVAPGSRKPRNAVNLDVVLSRRDLAERHGAIAINGCDAYAGWIAPSGATGQVAVSSRVLPDVFLNCMRQICIRLAFNTGGLALHAGCTVRNNSAILFAGKSGAGKSTICRLSPYPVPADDLVVVRGKAAKFLVWGLPGRSGPAPCSTGPFPIERVFVLAQDTTNRAESMSKARAAASILALMHDMISSDRLASVLAIVNRFVDHVPVAELHFLNDASIWEYIDAMPETEG